MPFVEVNGRIERLYGCFLVTSKIYYVGSLGESKARSLNLYVFPSLGAGRLALKLLP